MEENYSILDRACKECSTRPAKYERCANGKSFRRTCVNCRAQYMTHWYEETNRVDLYKPKAPPGVTARPALVKRCRGCLEVKPIDEFYYTVTATDKRQSHCKKCRDAKREERRLATPKTDKSREAQRIRNDRFKARLAPYKELVFQHYGNGCYCCGETMREFLTIDHKNNDGGEKRRQRRGLTGAMKHKEIVDAGFPDDLQIACYNCNSGRARTPDKICPHEAARGGILKLAA